MRVRTSPGISADQYQGAVRLSGSEVQLAGVDANKTVAVVLRYDDKLKEGSLVYVQVIRGVSSGMLVIIMESVGSTTVYELERREETETTQPSSMYQLTLRGCECS